MLIMKLAGQLEEQVSVARLLANALFLEWMLGVSWITYVTVIITPVLVLLGYILFV
jgi:hypothetical protein